MRRQPPTLGATGLDFGAKPAVSFALPRKKAIAPPLDDDSAACDPVWCAISQVTIQATLSGTLNHKDDGCGGGASFSISATTGTATCLTPAGCVSSCITDSVPVDYTCDPECDPFTGDENPMFQMEVVLICPGEDGGDWFLDLNGGISDVGELFMCNKAQFVGGALILEVNLGPDPSVGSPHTFSFDDPTSGTAHFDVVVAIT